MKEGRREGGVHVHQRLVPYNGETFKVQYVNERVTDDIVSSPTNSTGSLKCGALLMSGRGRPGKRRLTITVLPDDLST
jgi:hypothetical protein